MLRRSFVAALMILAGCQSLALSRAPDNHTVDPPTPPATTWMETEIDGIRLGMPMPEGWLGDTMDGLMLAEPAPTVDNQGLEVGVVVYLFVPELSHFNLPQNERENIALTVLDRVVEMPSEIGVDVATSEPVAFTWDGHDAAYYLLTVHDGMKTVVIAIETGVDNKLVMCNVSMPDSEAHRVREMLPQVLDGLTINGEQMDGAALNVLPDPLIFPQYDSPVSEASPVVQ